jgi:hypothetical protein
MKLKYTNFKHYASSAPDPEFVPSHLVRKHWSLITIEMYHLFASIVGLGLAFFSFGRFSLVYPIFLFFCSLSMFASSLLSIMDNYRYRSAYIFTNILFPAILFFIAPVEFSFAIAAVSVLVIITILRFEKNNTYFEWCKSISSN